jgi:hypothetical protein
MSSVEQPKGLQTTNLRRNYIVENADPEASIAKDDADVGHDHVSDPDFEGLTLYEKKALLVNRELDRQGMGRYQWMVFLLCGFGYFLDLLWAQAFGLVVPVMQYEFGFSDAELGNIFTCFSAGLTAGTYRAIAYKHQS